MVKCEWRKGENNTHFISFFSAMIGLLKSKFTRAACAFFEDLLISHGNRVGGNWQGKCTSGLAVPWTNWIGEKSCKLFISVQILSAAMILLGTLMKKERTGHVSQTHAFRSVYGCVIKFSTEKHRGRGYVTTHIGLITPILAHPSDDFKNYSPIMT